MSERILFVGGKNVGNEILRTIIKTENIVAIYSNSSDEVKDWYLQVKPVAKVWGIPYSIENVNKQIEKVKDLGIDWIVCAYYDHILSDELLSIPRKGSVNVHLGLAYEYKGCYPTTFPIIDGKDHAGVTIHKITKDVDGGDIYGTAVVEVEKTETGKSLYFKCTAKAKDLFQNLWGGIKSGGIKAEPDPRVSQAVYHTRQDFPSHEIDLSWSPEKIDRMVRALTFDPFPKPYFKVGVNKYNIVYEA